MNLNNVFAKTLGLSLALGLLIFMIGVPIGFLTMDHFKIAEDDGFLIIIAIAMYIVYWPVQITLSITHRLVSQYWRTPSSSAVLQSLFVCEWILYLIVYLFCVCAFYEKDIWLTIFLFSIPYIICCTISVYLYKNLYEKELKRFPDSAPEIQ
ncbi:MAG: hypothetical protein JSS76_14265 [Bacteroidetes bacterium]|nr:hypothetical protein [Bacteroidota bacterium]